MPDNRGEHWIGITLSEECLSDWLSKLNSKLIEDWKLTKNQIKKLLKNLSKSNIDGKKLEQIIEGVNKEKRDEIMLSLLESEKVELTLFGPIDEGNDFTFYIKREHKDRKDAVEHLLLRNSQERSKKKDQKKFSYDCSMEIQEKPNGKKASGRVLACLCYEGCYWSLTFRKQSETDTKNNVPHESQSGEKPKDAPNEKPSRMPLSEYDPIRIEFDESKFLNKAEEICDALYKQIFNPAGHQHTGIVVVTGRTGTLKSEIVRGLIYKYLTDLKAGNRRPHMLTFEDPIEKAFFREKKGKYFDPLKTRDYGLDYTPRQKNADARDIRSVVNDALRQTPTVLFVGETREMRNWKELMRFAGTGHLVFTTAHAGSLTEAMGNIFRATGTVTPSQRSVIADRILALIHLKPDEVCVKPECKHIEPKEYVRKKINIPAIWRHTPGGAKALTAEGRASLIPHNPEDNEMQYSSLGRKWFAKELLKDAKRRLKTRYSDVEKAVLTRAIEWDLEGI